MDDDGKQLEDMVMKAANQLAEHFECGVQILCSTMKGKETRRIFRGEGNLYCREGMAREFVLRSETITKQDVIKEVDDEDKY